MATHTLCVLLKLESLYDNSTNTVDIFFCFQLDYTLCAIIYQRMWKRGKKFHCKIIIIIALAFGGMVFVCKKSKEKKSNRFSCNE